MNKVSVYDVRHVQGDSAFLIDDGKTSVLYDTGFAFSGYSVAENIRKILGTRPLDYIFLTHSHYDHAAGTAYIKRAYPNVCVVAAEYAAKIFAKDSAKGVMRRLDKKVASQCGVFEYDDLFDELSVDLCVNDSDIVRAGDMTFDVISLPGHTKCSVAYYLRQEKLLLSCETIGVYSGDEVVPSYLVGYKMTISSIEKAKKLDIKNILSPHYGLVGEEKTKSFFEMCEKSAIETARDFLKIYKSGGDSAQIVEYFKNKFYHGYVVKIYPEDAMILNTGIMAELVKNELGGGK